MGKGVGEPATQNEGVFVLMATPRTDVLVKGDTQMSVMGNKIAS
jgi:hypothetical protein